MPAIGWNGLTVELLNGKMGKIVIRISVIRYSGIIVCAGGGVRPLIDVIPSPVIARN